MKCEVSENHEFFFPPKEKLSLFPEIHFPINSSDIFRRKAQFPKPHNPLLTMLSSLKITVPTPLLLSENKQSNNHNYKFTQHYDITTNLLIKEYDILTHVCWARVSLILMFR